MQRLVLSLAAVLALTASGFAPAADSEPDADDIVILSVKPRSAEVKPIAMVAPASGHAADAPPIVARLPAPPQRVARDDPQSAAKVR